MSNQFLTHPVSGCIRFGDVPEMKSRGIILLGGEIRLQTGKHTGPHKGWGANHIWAEHEREMAKKRFMSINDVPAYVASIIRVGTPLIFDGQTLGNIKLMAVQATSGMAILGLRERREGAIWTIITAYDSNKPHGTRVGSVR